MVRVLPRSVRVLFVLVMTLSLALMPTAPLPAQAPVEPAAPDGVDALPGLVPLTGVAAIAAGIYHTCALLVTGAIKCWGLDTSGQLGDGADNTEKLTPVDVTGISSAIAIGAGKYHTCAVLSTGAVKCWGYDDQGQLGDGPDNNNKSTPVDVIGITNAIAVSGGSAHTCALLSSGAIKCWGYDANGQVGDAVDNESKSAPVDVKGIVNATGLSTGASFSCAVLETGAVKCWGSDADGQLGNNLEFADQSTPVAVAGINDATSIGAGANHACAVLSTHYIKCWGRDESGQIGDGAINVDRPTPVYTNNLRSDAIAVTAGDSHTCALVSNGSLKCWGLDGYGQVGDGFDDSDKVVPSDVVGVSNAAGIAAGTYFTCGVLQTGTAKCWGNGNHGQLGNGMRSDQALPTDVVVPRTCFRLMRVGSGGPAPTAALTQTTGCPLDHYLSGTQVGLTAIPAPGTRVQSWGAATGAPGSILGVLVMPAADTTVTVTYAACRTLTLSHSGSGGNPQAAPDRSAGCEAGKFAAGDGITLTAVPSAGFRVKSWSGTSATPATGSQVNGLVMPNANATVGVAYEACFALSTAKVGEGSLPMLAPAFTYGCLTGGFAAGEGVVVQAQPAVGWLVAGWEGTQNDASTSATNSVVMGASPSSVKVIYAPAQQRVHLPLVRR